MKKYYCVYWRDNPEIASACYEGENQFDYELISRLEGKNEMLLDFNLRRIKEGKDGLTIDDNTVIVKDVWLDYQPNSLVWPIMSEKFKSIIEASLKGNEQIDWITCNLRNLSETREYYILRFNKQMDVLDKKKTLFMDERKESVIKPVFSFSKIKDYSLFVCPSSYNFWKIPSSFHVNEEIKKKIQKEKLTGIEFEKAIITE